MATFTRIKFPGISISPLLPALGPIWTPAQLSDQFWYWDADSLDTISRNGSSVLSWSTSMGDDLDLVPFAAYYPTYSAGGWDGSSACLNFPGNADVDSGAMLIAGHGDPIPKMTAFVVTERATQNDDATSGTRCIISAPSANNYVAQMLVNRPGNEPAQNTWNAVGLGTGAGTGVQLSPFSVGQKAILEMQVTDASPAFSARQTGGAAVSGGALGTSFTTTQIQIGGYRGNRRAYKGKIKKVLLVANTLSAENRQKAEGFLAWSSGVQDQLPASHPYRTAGPLAA